MSESWPVRLFSKSPLKQRKYSEMVRALGETEGRRILEIGSDNGVFSYLFRQRGGQWKSADLDERSVQAMRDLVESDVYRIADGQPLPFETDEFDTVIIVDIIEHLHHDADFMDEIYRVLKAGGLLIVNAPTIKTGSLLMKLRKTVGVTEDAHGHVRPGYSLEDLQRLLGHQFKMVTYRTHTKFFSKFTDTLMVIGISLLKRKQKEETSGRGVLVTGRDMKAYEKTFRIYSLLYPFVRLVAGLDRLLFFRSGYMFIAKGYSNKS